MPYRNTRPVRIFCNNCGGEFSTEDHARRFCGRACAARFWAPLKRGDPTSGRAPTQARVVEALRAAGGAWISQGDLALAVYDGDDSFTRQSVKVVVHRLRANWADRGLVIGRQHVGHPFAHNRVTYYRLEHDIDAGHPEMDEPAPVLAL